MSKIEIYSTQTCGFCFAAKRLLKSKGAKFTEFDINLNPEKRGEMLSRASGKRTVPQIFIDSFHIGGCDELYNLEHGGNLDGLLSKT